MIHVYIFYIKVKLHFCTLRFIYGEYLDISFITISYLLSPRGYWSQKDRSSFLNFITVNFMVYNNGIFKRVFPNLIKIRFS